MLKWTRTLVLGAFLLFSAQGQAEMDVASTTIDKDKLSEAFGHFIGKNLKSPGLDFNVEKVIQGIRDGAAGKPSPMSDQEYETMMALAQMKAYSELSEKNLKDAETFLGENAKKAGITEIDPGKLQYEVILEGSGAAVAEGSTPSLHYTGKYIDGEVFSSSEEAGEPITISLDQTIPGFGKGITGMKEGEKRRLFIHPDLGYGTTGSLPPNSLLIFDIEILEADTKK